MNVFFYDKSFEGLLSAVFDAYARKKFPDLLLEKGDVPPLLVEYSHEVVTCPEKTERVWSGLRKKLPKLVLTQLTYAWLSETAGSDEVIFRYIRKAFDKPHCIATDFNDEDVLSLKKLTQKVSKEVQYLAMFIRFQRMADGIYFAPVAPVYNVLPLATGHLVDRFSDQRWIVYDEGRKYGYYYNQKTVMEMALDDESSLQNGRLREDLMAGDEKLFQDLWKRYFKTLTIKERMNRKLQRQHMPQRYWKYITEKQ
ncbi:MAG: TIGR03915 family putative DNA repair protein [Puniceicoccales bacterium]|jgi:probable DNA metabolism protein|nr:TIGR03915 family putative DNA repair protein [Puniceicoccales bacterium]